MINENYNSWTNRETWALNIWLGNTQENYETVIPRIRTVLYNPIITDAFEGYPNAEEDLARWRVTQAGDALRDLWRELTEADSAWPYKCLAMREVGSVWRVDWDQLGVAWLEDVEEWS